MTQQETFTKEQFWASLDKLGEDEVHLRYTLGKYASGDKRGLVQEWLYQLQEARIEAARAEQMRAARSANTAAWIAAIAAIVAAVAATIALYPILTVK